MRIHWAIYGERNGGHALLGFSDDTPLTANKLIQYTDRPGDPPIGAEWGPVETGFHFADHFVFLRTMPDLNAGRAGMVRSYAAYVAIEEIGNVNNILAIFDALPKILVNPAPKPLPFDISEEMLLNKNSLIDGPIRQIARLLCSPQSTFPIIWVRRESYLPTIASIWGKLPSNLRKIFAFSFQYAPEHRLPLVPTIVATIPGLANRWPQNSMVIGSGDEYNSQELSVAESYIAGSASGEDFERVLSEYGISLHQFNKLSLYSTFADLVSRLDELNFSEAKKAIQILTQNSEPNDTVFPSREKLIKKLSSLSSHSNPEDLASLRNLKADGFPEIISSLQSALTDRISYWASSKKFTNDIINLLLFAIDAPRSWWSIPFLGWLKKCTASLSADEVSTVYDLLESKPLSTYLDTIIQRDPLTEAKLVLGAPALFSKNQSESVLMLSENRKWMRLHASTLLVVMPAVDALARHLKSAITDEGLPIFQEKMGFLPLFENACLIDSEILRQYVRGALINNDKAVQEASSSSLSANSKIPMCILVLNAAIEPASPLLQKFILDVLDSSTAYPERVNLAFACVAFNISIILKCKKSSELFSQISDDQRKSISDSINIFVQNEVRHGRRVLLQKDNVSSLMLDRREVIRVLSELNIRDTIKTGIDVFRHIEIFSDVECVDWLVSLFTKTANAGVGGDDSKLISDLLLEFDFPLSANIVRETFEHFHRSDVEPIYSRIRYKYQISRHYEGLPTTHRKQLITVLIATALPLEREEVIKFLNSTSYDAGLFADVAYWPVSKPIFEVFVIATGAGNVPATFAVSDALKRGINPTFAFFVGVAGGVKDSDIGDVVYGTKVYYFESGKEADDEFKSRPEVEHVDEALIQLAHRIAGKNWQPTGLINKPKATPAVIASGEVVLASTDPNAKNYQLLRSSYNDAQVVDMEAYGFLLAMRRNNVRYAMVIRGVSDKIAGKAESDAKGNQPLAVKNATAFLFELISQCPQVLNDIKPPIRKRDKEKYFGIVSFNKLWRRF